MRTRQSRFAAVLHQREARGGVGEDEAGTARRLPNHPIDFAALVFAEVRRARIGPHPQLYADLILVGTSFGGGPAGVEVEAGLRLAKPPAVWGALYRRDDDLVPIRVGWTMRDGKPPPDVSAVYAEVHPVVGGQAFQFMREAGRERREWSLFACRDVALFSGVRSVTFGLPWRTEHGELWLRFDEPPLGITARRVVEAAVS